MTTTQAREVFNTAIKSAKNAEQVARIELAREFFTNADFRKNLSDYVWNLNK
jgi:hypothetical protein